jgi:hypothetical protein
VVSRVAVLRDADARCALLRQLAQRIAGGEWIGQASFWVDPLFAYVLGVAYTWAGHDVLLPA